MARAWVINDYSGYQGLTLTSIDEEAPGPGEIRLRIEAFALNWGDMDLMKNSYSFSFASFPTTVGIEAAGIVDAIGEGVSDIDLGERYCTLPYFYGTRGASTESLIIPSRYVTKAPKSLSAVESASIWMQYMTAYYPIVELSKAGPESCILVPAGTGTAGTAALEIGRLRGAKMITTTRYERNRDFLMAAGADFVHVQGSEDLAKLILDVSDGAGIDAAFDPIGAGMIGTYSSALAKNACIYCYGALDGQFPSLPMGDMYKANATFHPYSLFHYVEDKDMQAKGVAFVNESLESGKIAPRIDRVYPMEQYRDAWDYLSAPREAHGKVLIETGL